MRFKICLTNSIFAPDYSNARHFDSRSEQEAYFRVNELFTSSVPERNVNFGTLVNLQVYVKTGESGIGDVMSSNYAIIKELATGKFYYYFITNTSFDSANQVRLDLTLDVIQTYYLDMTFGDAVIERACLNRFESVSAQGSIFSKGVDSKFLMRDEIHDIPKRIKSITRAGVSFQSPKSPLSMWIDENIDAWLYVFLDAGTYESGGVQFDEQMRYIKGDKQYRTPYVVCVAPIFKRRTAGLENYQIRVGANSNDLHSMNEISALFLKTYSANIYSIKVSKLCPFYNGANLTYSIHDDDIGEGAIAHYLDIMSASIGDVPQYYGGIWVMNVQKLEPQYLTKYYTLPQAQLTKNRIATYNDDLRTNPKIFNSDYMSLKISFCGGEYEFDIQKLWHSSAIDYDEVVFRYYEVLTPEISAIYISIDTNDGVYNDAYLNKIGYLSQIDTSMPYSKNQLDVFLANNKNFFKIKETGYQRQWAQYGVNTAFAGANGLINLFTGGNPMGSVGVITGALKGAIDTQMSIDYDRLNTKYSLDDMRAGVDALANSNGNVFFNDGISDLSILIEEMEGLPVDVERALEDVHENGYLLNRMGDIKDYDNIRRNWNYIRAKVEIIKTPVKIPNEVRNIVKAIFARGIRFWNTNNITYHQTNLER